jgi:hypothetical protein
MEEEHEAGLAWLLGSGSHTPPPVMAKMVLVTRRTKTPSWWVTRVSLANVLDEGLRIEGRGCRINSKVKIKQTR